MFIFAAFRLLCLVVTRELCIFWVILARFDVKSQGQSVKNILVLAAVSVVVPHVDEKSLLVVQVLIELEAVVNFLHLSLTRFELGFQVLVP